MRIVPLKWARIGLALAFMSGLALAVIGLRFLFQPTDAAMFFGVSRSDPGFAFHHAIALRDLWLGLIAMAFALLRDWRALMLWFGLGALVCFGDAWIAWTSSGRWVSVSFHVGSGIFCATLAGVCGLRWKRT